ncbi:peptidoglycan-binding protein [candidate division KSB1 bacterium]|nr:peptidoglycan-binding protein [candidate division KSB1 bacterium]
MPESQPLAKAELHELDANFTKEINPDKAVKVQFNPESLKVSFANQIATSDGPGDQKGTPSRQHVGAGTTKLLLQLWFDVTAPQPEGETRVNDVRKLTQKVAYFITPKEQDKKFIPPAVRFLWGSFQFDGLMESMEESLEFFSHDGYPLRASVSISLSQQKITVFSFSQKGLTNIGGLTRGTSPLTQVPMNSTLPGMAETMGKGENWQAIAKANNIENPRLLKPGQLIDMNLTK